MTSRRWDFVSEYAGEFGVQRLCRVLQVSRSGYYRWLAGAEARDIRQAADQALAAEIREIHAASGETYGFLRVYADLQGSGHHVNRKRVARLMREHGIVGRHLPRRKRTTVPDSVAPPAVLGTGGGEHADCCVRNGGDPVANYCTRRTRPRTPAERLNRARGTGASAGASMSDRRRFKRCRTSTR
ncbi:IS3 family transposase [Kitasatospora sp. NPDC101235]|uniref:IS3 family transposase n=1 Tax=Kitasatospora sp. NPDC101235 TaxID=3364101 RepID=UPI00381482B4